MKKILLVLTLLSVCATSYAQYTPPQVGGSPGPQGSPGISGSPGATGSPGPEGSPGPIATPTPGVIVSDTAYDAGSWDGVTTTAPSKNAVRDKIEAVVASIPAVGEFVLNPGGTTINLNSTTAQDVYTVPVGKVLIVTKAIWHSPNGGTFDGGNTTLLFVQSSVGDVIITCSVTGASTLDMFLITDTAGAKSIIAAGDKAQAKPDAGWGDAVTAKVVVFGYLFDA